MTGGFPRFGPELSTGPLVRADSACEQMPGVSRRVAPPRHLGPTARPTPTYGVVRSSCFHYPPTFGCRMSRRVAARRPRGIRTQRPPTQVRFLRLSAVRDPPLPHELHFGGLSQLAWASDRARARLFRFQSAPASSAHTGPAGRTTADRHRRRRGPRRRLHARDRRGRNERPGRRHRRGRRGRHHRRGSLLDPALRGSE